MLNIIEHDNYIEIEGMRYSNALFEAWGVRGMAEGQLFRLMKRDDGMMEIRYIDESECPEAERL